MIAKETINVMTAQEASLKFKDITVHPIEHFKTCRAIEVVSKR